MSDQLIRVQIPVTPTAFSLKRKTWEKEQFCNAKLKLLF